jgi:hypothetical protein
VKTPQEVAADATRHCGWLLQHDLINRVELTCSPSVGTHLLSSRRAQLDSYEKLSNKRIHVRISEEIATDRVSYYAYDVRDSDIDLESLPVSKSPTVDSLLKSEHKIKESGEESSAETSTRQRSRRRGRRKAPLADATTIAGDDNLDAELASLDIPKKERHKKSKKTTSKRKDTPAESAVRVYQFARTIGKSSKEIVEMCKEHGDTVRGHMSTMTQELITLIKEKVEGEQGPSKPRRRRRKRGSRKKTPSTKVEQDSKTDSKPKPKKKRSRRSAKKTRKKNPETTATTEVQQTEVKPAKSRRTLYGGRRRSISTDEVKESMVDRS